MDAATLIEAAKAGRPQLVSDRWLDEHEASDACMGLVTVPNDMRTGLLDAYLLCTPGHTLAVARRAKLGLEPASKQLANGAA